MAGQQSLPQLRSLIQSVNARYLGVDISHQIEVAASGVASAIIKKYGKSKSICFICNLETNGRDGMSAARHMILKGYSGKISVYLLGRVHNLTPDSHKQWEMLQNLKLKFPDSDLHLVNDANAAKIDNHQVIVECAADSGAAGKKLRDAIKRCSHFRQKMVCLDNPVDGYTWDYAISIAYPKVLDATVVEVDLPEVAEQQAGPGDVQALIKPNTSSHKAQNAKILIIGGDIESLSVAAATAGQFARTVYVHSTTHSDAQIVPLANLSGEIVRVSAIDLEMVLAKADTLLIGPGWQHTLANKTLLNYILEHYRNPIVLTGVAATNADLRLVKSQAKVVFGVNRSELSQLLNSPQSTNQLEGKLRRFCLDYNCHVLLKGSASLSVGRNLFTQTLDLKICSQSNAQVSEWSEYAGGMLTSLLAKNPVWISASAASFLTGVAAQLANSSSDINELIRQLPAAWTMAREF